MSDQKKGSVRAFFGGLLMTAGVLIGGLSGLCTAGFLIFFVLDALKRTGLGDELFSAIWIPLAFGFVPIVLGVVLFNAGRAVRRAG